MLAFALVHGANAGIRGILRYERQARNNVAKQKPGDDHDHSSPQLIFNSIVSLQEVLFFTGLSALNATY